MATLTSAALNLLRNHHGIICVQQLTACKVTRSTRQLLIEQGILIRVHRGVYRIASQAVTLESRCVALCALRPDGFVTGPTGGKLSSLRRMPTEMTKPPKDSDVPALEVIHFSVRHGARINLDGVRVRQSRTMELTDVQVRADGIRIASPWRLAFDLAADLEPDDLESVLEQIQSKSLCQFITLARTARRLARPARPGSGAFVAALSSRIPGGPLESHPEVRLAKALQQAGIPIVAQSTWLTLPNGNRARLDLSVPVIKWGVEVDVHPDHFLRQRTADRRRDRQCHQLGWQVDRVTSADLLDLPTLVTELVTTYHARVAEIAQCAG